MLSRSKSRLLTALLLVLASFGGAGSAFAVVQVSQAMVWVRGNEKSEPHPVSERHTSPVPALRPISLKGTQREQRLPYFYICRWLFQRPPPALLLSYS